MAETLKANDAIWEEMQQTIDAMLASEDSRQRMLGEHFKKYIVREGDSFRYTGPWKWKVSGLGLSGRCGE